MFEMLGSASRVVLLLFAATISAALFLRILDPKEFMVLASMVFAFYFTKPPDKSTDDYVK